MNTVCRTILLLVICVQWIAQAEIPKPLEPSKRDLLAENPFFQFTKYVDDFLSEGDPLEVLLNVAVSSQKNRIDDLQSRIGAIKDDFSAMARLVNSELGGNVLVIADNSLRLDADAIASLLQSKTIGCIKDLFKTNLFLQKSLIQAVNTEISIQLPDLRQSLRNSVLPLADVQKLFFAVAGESSAKSKRDLTLPYSIVLEVLRAYVTPIITPVYNSIVKVLDSTTSALLELYVQDLPSNVYLQAVVDVTNQYIFSSAQFLAVLRGRVNVLFTAIVNGASSSSRKRREAEFDLQEFLKVLDVDERGVEVVHRRLRRSSSFWSSISSAISSVFTFIWNIISTVVSTGSSSITSVISSAGSLIWSVISTLWSLISSSLNLVQLLAAYLTGGIAGVISYLWGIISEYANTYIKEWFVSWISSYYEEVGESTTYPLRWVVNWLVNLVFDCSTTEIV